MFTGSHVRKIISAPLIKALAVCSKATKWRTADAPSPYESKCMQQDKTEPIIASILVMMSKNGTLSTFV